MEILDVISRITHVSTAIVLVGGTAFSLFVVLPSVSVLGEASRGEFVHAITGRWKRFVHGGILLFLISGFYNYFRAMPQHKGDGLYHGLVGTKIILAFIIFFIAAALVGRSSALEKMRQNRGFWMRVIVVLAIVIVAISGYLKVRGVL